MKKILFIICLLCISISLFASKEIIKEPKERVSPEVFPIMPYGYDYNLDLDDYLSDLYDCGFNVSSFIEPNRVPLAKKNKLKALVYGGNVMDNNIEDLTARAHDWTKKLKSIIGEENFPYVYQVFVKDEPLLQHIEYTKIFSNILLEDTVFKPYVNLNPNYASEEQIGPSYEKYCTDLVKGCKLDYLSYDNYSIFVDKGLDEDRFYSNLEAVRKICSENNIRLINIINSVGHFNYAEPSDYSIHVQGWSTLAYGGGGLTYFTFYSPNRGNFRAGAYDVFGQRTSVWNIIKRMNLAIHHIMPYYKDLEYLNAFHVGNVPKGSRGVESAKLVKEIAAVYGSDDRYEGKPNFLVGEFKSKKDGKEYVIIVNKESSKSIYINWVSFKNQGVPCHIQEMSLQSPECSFEGEDRWISPGHGVLLRVDK